MKQYIKELFTPKEIGKTVGILFATFIYAIGLNIFISPIGLYTGGIMGVSQIIRALMVDYLHIQVGNFDVVGIIFYLINLPLFIIAFKTMGKMFFVKTMLSVASMSFFLTFIPIPKTVLLTNDILASSLIGSILCGVGIGLTLMMGASSGGIDIIGMYLVKKKGNFSIGKANLILNVFVYLVCMLLFDVKTVIYSVIGAAASSIAIDKVHTQNINVEVIIITRNDIKLFEDEVMETLGRGITKWDTQGAYTGEGSEILYIVLSKYEVVTLRKMIHKYDPDAFIVVKEGVWVQGNYMKKL